MTEYHVGDEVRVLQVPPCLYRDDPISKETAAIFEKSLGGVFRIMDFDNNGHLELWLTSEGQPRAMYESGLHIIWIEPEYVEMVRVLSPSNSGQQRSRFILQEEETLA